MPKPARHLFVCMNSRPPGVPRPSCGAAGASDVMTRFREEIENRELWMTVKVSGSTCLGPCDFGPTVVVYPDAVWYAKVQPDDVAEIVEKHLVGGEPVERLLMPDELWG